ncbi:hypothetical protein [Streptomyces sp. ISL-94]|uniref:hypothetical protein n=1 Tax=Streptomyces sp. ISL-94 TaxID=2819190 RepID=UPI001BEC3BC9|nr:hypothetical protein [Streptomyces sp. ISL-94]MBT2478127.1 hypothetical protein [Streptomyces sp. ISL-94]
MSTDPVADHALVHAKDITAADVERLEAFLKVRVARAAGAARGSDEQQRREATR